MTALEWYRSLLSMSAGASGVPWWRAGPFAGGPAPETQLRRDAGRILQAGIAAADPGEGVRRALERRAASMRAARRVFILAVGKAADPMAGAAMAVLGDAVTGGLVVGPPDGPAPDERLKRVSGDHPVPGPSSLAAGAAVRELADGTASGDLVLCLISGGASALVSRPLAGVQPDDVAALTDGLLRAGASIGEINAVRRRVDGLKGGRLAAALSPAAIIGLLVSDVPGDRPADIGSGPLVPDPTGPEAALGILARYDLLDAAPPAVRRALSAPAAVPPAVDLEIVASAGQALAAAAAEADALGYAVDADPGHVTGEARILGDRLGREVRADAGPRAILRAGETTVTVRGQGRGGRNQEVALGAVEPLAGAPAALVAAMGTDGIDGPTDAAGAVATGTTALRARAAGLDAAAALADNAAWGFFDRLGDLIRSGPTGTNVMDLYIALARD